MPQLLNILGVRDVITKQENDAPIATTTPRKTNFSRSTGGGRPQLTQEEKEQRQAEREATKQANAEARKRMCVGVDFGCTFSGIAYVASNQTAKDVEIMTKWPGSPSEVVEKVPTRIAYAMENVFGTDQWGYSTKPGSTTSCWFKLLLDENTDPSEYDDPLLQSTTGNASKELMHLPQGKTADEVTVDYLTFIREHVFSRLQSMMGHRGVKETPVTFYLTLPATWSYLARDRTRQAAINAGFSERPGDEIVLIDEPEAAAIAAMKSTISAFGENSAFLKNTCTLVVDIGGGTIDCITHRIVRLDPLKLEEACIGEGGKRGGTSLNRGFHKLLSEKFGPSFQQLPIKKTGSGSLLMNTFEEIKREFMGSHLEDKIWELPLRMSDLDANDAQMKLWYDFEDDMVRISSVEVESMFEPLLKTTFELVRRQVKGTKKAGMPSIKTIVLCGGMAASPYVEYRVKKFVNDELKGKMEVIVPQRSWSAIARGAAIRGLELETSAVLYRRSRDNIGICVHERFDADRHLQEDYFECPRERDIAKNQMRWHVRRGERITPNLKKFFDTWATVERTAGKVIIKQDIFRSRLSEAPSRNDDNVEKIAQLEIDITKWAGGHWKRRKNNAGSAVPEEVEVCIKIGMTVGSDKGVLVASAKVNQSKVGAQVVAFNSDPNWREEIE